MAIVSKPFSPGCGFRSIFLRWALFQMAFVMRSLPFGMMIGLAVLLFTPVRGDDASIRQKLSSIVVSVDFTDARMDQAIAALAAMSKQFDPDHKGVQFVVEPEAAASARVITLKLNDVPLKEALRYVCELCSLRYKVNDHSILIMPKSAGQELVKRTFQVDPGFVQAAADAGVIPAPKTP